MKSVALTLFDGRRVWIPVGRIVAVAAPTKAQLEAGINAEVYTGDEQPWDVLERAASIAGVISDEIATLVRPDHLA